MRILLGSIVLLAAACATPVEQNPANPTTAGQALAQLACPHRIAEASAWVNYMPGPGRGKRDLNVDVRLVEATDTAVMLKSSASTGDTLVLEIRTAPTAPLAGHVAYREPAPEQLYKKVSFFCRGGEIYSLNGIGRVF
ncbi:MAG: hypothetical protein QM773_05830 [Hyphomonadaceae bacterium]